jgi:hypothetical protein
VVAVGEGPVVAVGAVVGEEVEMFDVLVLVIEAELLELPPGKPVAEK